jgi:hypothetical protein
MVNEDRPTRKDEKGKTKAGNTEFTTEVETLERSLRQYEGVIDRFDLGSNAEVLRFLQRLNEQQDQGPAETKKTDDTSHKKSPKK